MMKLKHSENKWNLERERRQFLEEEKSKNRDCSVGKCTEEIVLATAREWQM